MRQVFIFSTVKPTLLGNIYKIVYRSDIIIYKVDNKYQHQIKYVNIKQLKGD